MRYFQFVNSFCEFFRRGVSMTLRERIKELCKTKGVSLNRLENELDFAKGYISKLDKSTPNSTKLKAIADYLGVSVDYLLTGQEAEPNVKVIDEDNNLVVLDDETLELIDSLRAKPEMKMLFSVSKNATKEDILKAVKIIEALKDEQ